jgi:kumamolisin
VAALGVAPGEQRLELVLPLRVDGNGLRRFAAAVSTPGSPLYGGYESIPTLARRFGASSRVRSRVLSYLGSVGASEVRTSRTGLFVTASLPVSTAERVFGIRLLAYRVRSRQTFVAPAGAPSSATEIVPLALRGLVTGVIGLNTEPVLSSRRVQAGQPLVTGPQPSSGYARATGSPSGCPAGVATGGFTPNQYLTAYGYDGLRRSGITGAGERVALIAIDGFRRSDVTAFGSCFGAHVPPIRVLKVGLSKALPPGSESPLDLELLVAAAPRLKGIDVYERGSSPADDLKSFAAPLEHTRSIPQVESISFGTCEADERDAIGPSGIAMVDKVFQLAAADGITVVAAAGDDGSSDCTGAHHVPLHRLAVDFPSSSPWVTAVGGTNIVLNSGNHITGQVVWNDASVVLGAGGGGYSSVFSRPGYQRAVVARNARALPDIAILADRPGYAIYCSSCATSRHPSPWIQNGGTSAAAPLFAAGAALVDQYLRVHRRADLGRLNPLLYGIGGTRLGRSVFYDVTQIGNDIGPYIPGGNGRPLGCCTARAGYDEASGWGSVFLSRLASAAVRAEPRR